MVKIMLEEPSHLTYLARAIDDGHAELAGEGRNQQILYIASGYTGHYAGPEEKIRAELWAELVYQYQYPPNRIRFEVNVPRRTPNDFADLVIYEDDDLKSPTSFLSVSGPIFLTPPLTSP